MTRHVSYAEFSKNLAEYMGQVKAGPLHIEHDAGSAVLISEEEFEGWKETIYLLQSAANAKELLEGIRAADAGELDEHDIKGLL
jgi:antitoxin YefM